MTQLLLAALLAVPFAPGGTDDAAAIPWNARTVEHLYNRAAFGARPDEIAEGLRLGPKALVEKLISADVEWKDIEPELFRWEDMGFDHRQLPIPHSPFQSLPSEEQVHMSKSRRLVDRRQFFEMESRWISLCIANAAPVRDRMTLFWHSLFTTSIDVNKRKFEIIRQFQWLRRSALTSYASLLHGIVRDPAMLQYYDNTGNYKEHPNENFARELMELYSLGEGQYTETDVREAARALTGWACTSAGDFAILAERHDDGTKTILGRTGDLDADALVDILLERPCCARYITARLLRYFEGLPPSNARLDDYAKFLHEHDWSIESFLRRLFLDPAFYRDDAIGAKVAGPIEFQVAVCHKLDFTPVIDFSHEAMDAMGQSIYSPPSVKGWPEGLGWMVSDALLRRGNCVAIMVGALETRDSLEKIAANCEATDDDAPDSIDDAELGGQSRSMNERSIAGRRLEYARLRSYIDGRWWSPAEKLVPRLAKQGVASDDELVDLLLEDWLAIEPSPGLREVLLEYLGSERRRLDLGLDPWLDHPSEFEAALRHLAHVVFALPEAQLL